MLQRLKALLTLGITIAMASCMSGPAQSGTQSDELLAKIDQANQGIHSNSDWSPYTTEVDGFEMALVPAGCFEMGSAELANEMPIHEVCLTSHYWIDVSEVSNSQFQDYNGAAEDDSFVSLPDHPRENITFSEAAAFCESRGGRLPTEAEWEYAGRGPDSLLYPWGNEFDSSMLNYCDQNCTEFGPVNQDESANDGYAESSPVDAFPEDVSWAGAMGMAGNVHEMVSDWYSPSYYSESPRENPTGPEAGRQRTVRGGCWGCPADGSRLSYRHRNLSAPSSEESRSIVTGFRCILPIGDE